MKQIAALRAVHPVLRNPNGLRGTDYLSCGCPDVSVHSKTAWRPDESPYNRSVGILLGGEFALRNRTEHDDSFYLIFNMFWEEQVFDIPHLSGGKAWKVVLATDPSVCIGELKEPRITIPPRTIAVLQSEEGHGAEQHKRKKAKTAEER